MLVDFVAWLREPAIFLFNLVRDCDFYAFIGCPGFTGIWSKQVYQFDSVV
jgi:hypothetical protein